MFNPEKKKETDREAMIRDLGRVFIIFLRHIWWQITMTSKMNSINAQNFNKRLSGEGIDREIIK
jgi:hypothetical protein